MKVIKVGAVIIVNHDNYWNCLQQIKKYEDLISRGLGSIEPDYLIDKLETPFSNSCDNKAHSDLEYLNELKKACEEFELLYPVRPEIFGEIERQGLRELLKSKYADSTI